MNMTEGHRRNISSTFWLLDKTLCEFGQWAEGRACKSVLYEEVNNLSVAQRAKLLSHIDSLRSCLREAREALGMSPHTIDAARSIRVGATGMWIDLVEMGAKHLRGFGEVPPELMEFLDPLVERMQVGVQGIFDVVNGGPADPGGNPI